MNQIYLRFNAGVEYKGKIYASAIYINGLFQLDLVTQKVTYIKCFAQEKPYYAIHRAAFLHGNEAWFIPQNGKYIAVVNLDDFNIIYIKPPFRRVNKKAIERINAVYYSGGIIANKFLYLVPTNIDTLLIIDLDSKKLYPYYDIPYTDEYFLFGTYSCGSIYLMPYIGNSIVKINLRTNDRNRYLWKYPFEDYLSLVSNQSQIWVGPYHSKYLLNMDLKTKRIDQITVRECDDDCIYEQMILKENILFIIPFDGDKILRFELNNKKKVEIDLDDELLVDGKNGFTEIFSEDNLILASYKNNFILVYDKKLENFQKIKISIKSEDLMEALKKNEDLYELETADAIHRYIFIPDGLYNEVFWKLNNYIKINLEEKKRQNRYFIENFGGIIWKRVKDDKSLL